jgi:hypothetical protein
MNCIEKVSEEYIVKVSLNSTPKLTADAAGAHRRLYQRPHYRLRQTH